MFTPHSVPGHAKIALDQHQQGSEVCEERPRTALLDDIDRHVHHVRYATLRWVQHTEDPDGDLAGARPEQ